MIQEGFEEWLHTLSLPREPPSIKVHHPVPGGLIPVLGYALAVLVGLSLGLIGGGGSILTVPILVYALGYPMKSAVPMSLGVVGLTSAVGALRHVRARTVRLPAALAFAPAAMLGTLAGTRLADALSGRTQLVIFALVMAAAALAMFRPVRPSPLGGPHGGGLRAALRAAPAGLGVGVLTGMVGVGGGFLIVPALVLLIGLPMHEAVGTSLVVIALNSAAGVAGYAGRVAMDWGAMALFTALAVAGVLVGAGLAPRVPAGRLRRWFAIFLVVMAGWILWQNLGQAAGVPGR
jgi:uncharacterized membrane protein YfcA